MATFGRSEAGCAASEHGSSLARTRVSPGGESRRPAGRPRFVASFPAAIAWDRDLGLAHLAEAPYLAVWRKTTMAVGGKPGHASRRTRVR